MHTSAFTVSFATLVAVGAIATGCGSTSSHGATQTSPSTEPAPAPRARQTSAVTPQIVATVDGKAITLSVLNHWAAVAADRQIGVPEPPDYTSCIEHLRSITPGGGSQSTRFGETCKKEYEELVKPALSSLIHAQWLIDEGAAEGLTIDRAQLARESTTSGPRAAAVRHTLETTVETRADVELTQMLSMLSSEIYRKLERRIPSVTSRQISEYYAAHRAHYLVPEQRDLHILRTETYAAAKQARVEIEHGTSFAAIVEKTQLQQPDTSHEGLLLGLRPENYPEIPLRNAIFRARPRTLGGPVQIEFGYYIFEVIRIVPAHQRTLSEVEPEIATQLHRTLRDHVVTRFVTAFRAKWAAKTSCRPGYVVKHCSQYRPSSNEPREDPASL